jgi:pyrroline-5-carboxylate reductase
MSLPSIAFIGFGKMAEGIYRGLLSSSLVEDVVFVEQLESRRKEIVNEFGLRAIKLTDVINFSIIIVCIKPQQIKELLEGFKNSAHSSLWISILAGTPLSTYENYLGKGAACIRVMPNLAVTVCEGMSALACSRGVSESQKEDAVTIFSSVGRALFVPEEWLDIVTGISGSGPAFCYHLADAIAKVGEEKGMDYKTALVLIAQTMVGAGKMLLESNKKPLMLSKEVTSPGGTTAAGLEIFEKSNIGEKLQEVILAAIHRSIELGN